MRLKLVVISYMLASSVSFADNLYEAVQRSLITNPDVLYNEAKSLSAQQGVDKARSAYYPTIDATGGFGREESQNPTTTAIDGVGSSTLNRRESSIEMRQNLFSGGGIAYEYKRNKYIFQSQKLKTLGVAEDLSLEAINSYLQVLLNEKLFALAKINLRVHRSVFSMIKERSDAGIAREAELDQADARLALAESNLISSEANLREAKITYAKIVGAWPGKLAPPKVPKRKELPATLAQTIEMGLENHPTIKSSYSDIKQAKSQYEVARAAYYPKVDFVVSASRNRNLDGLIGPNNDKLAMIRMNYNLFRGGADEANTRLTAYQVQESYEIKNKAIIDLRESVRLSWNAWSASTLRLSPLRRHMVTSRETRGAYEEQFKVGKRTLLDLLDSQNEYYEAQIAYVRGQNDEIYARYRILNSMGMILPYLKMRLPKNVVNNDVFTSAQNHILLNKNMDNIPYPDDTDKQMVLIRPVKNLETAPLTPGIVRKNTGIPIPVAPAHWYVQAGFLPTVNQANALSKRIHGLGFDSFVRPCKGGFSVLLGPYEYRGLAGNTMERLKEIAHVKCILVTFKKDKAGT